jgi:hypothetical protein
VRLGVEPCRVDASEVGSRRLARRDRLARQWAALGGQAAAVADVRGDDVLCRAAFCEVALLAEDAQSLRLIGEAGLRVVDSSLGHP